MAVLPCLPRGHRRDFSPKREKSADPYAQASRPSTSTIFRTVCVIFGDVRKGWLFAVGGFWWMRPWEAKSAGRTAALPLLTRPKPQLRARECELPAPEAVRFACD